MTAGFLKCFAVRKSCSYDWPNKQIEIKFLNTNMNNALGKIIGGCGCVVGALGFALGMFAVFAPDQFAPVEKALESPPIGSFMDRYFPVLLIGFFVIVFAAAFSPLILGAIKKHQMRGRLKMVGQKGEARILSIHDTGITINNDPYIKIFLEVNGTRAEISTSVSRVGIPRPGEMIRVVYDPSDPTVVLPEFEMN